MALEPQTIQLEEILSKAKALIQPNVGEPAPEPALSNQIETRTEAINLRPLPLNLTPVEPRQTG